MLSLNNQKPANLETKTATIQTGKYAKHQEPKVDDEKPGWQFLFSPAQLDEDISLEQFSADPLPIKEMQQYGI